MILGHFEGVRTGIRQLIRTEPLETIRLRGLRIRRGGDLSHQGLSHRQTEHDAGFPGFRGALRSPRNGESVRALRRLDRLYPQHSGGSVLQQLAVQLSEPLPWDLTRTDLTRYKALKPPYTDWNEVRRHAFAAAQAIMRDVL